MSNSSPVIIDNRRKGIIGETIIKQIYKERGSRIIPTNHGSDFIETVIDDWMMGETVNCNGWEGNLYIIKKELKNEPIQKNFGVGKLV